MLLSGAKTASRLRPKPPHQKGLISILIPALETRAELLGGRCLPSIEAQTYSNFEVIVVTESYSSEIDVAVQGRGSNFLYFWGTKRSRALKNADATSRWCSGAVPNLKLAIRKARGEFFSRMDDDDEWFPEHLEVGINFLLENELDFASSKALAADGSEIRESDVASESFGDDYEWKRLEGLVGTPITWLYRSHLRVLRFNANSWKKKINRPVDYDFLLRMAAAGARFGFNPRVTARQCLRPGAEGLTGHSAFVNESGSGPLD